MLIKGIRKKNSEKNLKKKFEKQSWQKNFNKINQCDAIIALLVFLEKNRKKKNSKKWKKFYKYLKKKMLIGRWKKNLEKNFFFKFRKKNI